MKFHVGNEVRVIDDEDWKDLEAWLMKEINSDLDLRNRYNKGETLTFKVPTNYEGKDETLIFAVSKPKLPMLGRVKLEFPKLKTRKRAWADPKSRYFQFEESFTEETKGEEDFRWVDLIDKLREEVKVLREENARMKVYFEKVQAWARTRGYHRDYEEDIGPFFEEDTFSSKKVEEEIKRVEKLE